MSKRFGLMMCTGGLVFAMAAEPSAAQVVITPGAVRVSSGGGAAAARRPGLMVSSGLSRFRDIRPRPLSIIEITETETTSDRDQLVSDLLQTVFEDVNLAIVAFHNTLLARAGRPPVIPTNIFNGGGSGGGGGGTNQNGGIDFSDVGGLIDQFSDFLPQGGAN